MLKVYLFSERVYYKQVFTLTLSLEGKRTPKDHIKSTNIENIRIKRNVLLSLNIT
jgi:hypothetical protein